MSSDDSAPFPTMPALATFKVFIYRYLPQGSLLRLLTNARTEQECFPASCVQANGLTCEQAL
eukprot:5928171-Amphidinium_carterae.1